MIFFDADVIGPWVYQQIGTGDYLPKSGSAIARVRDNEIIAGAVYERFNGVSVVASIAGSGRGWMNRLFLSMIFDYPFNQLKVRRITAFVDASNARAKRINEHLGFEQEAILHDAHPNGDILVYRMTADKCRWLKELPYESTIARYS